MLLELQDVSLTLAGRKGDVATLLEKVSFSVRAGERFVILGPSGAGKSTVLRLLNRLYEPTGGCILLHGVDIRETNVIELRRRCALVLQEPVTLSGSVEDNLLVGPSLKSKDLKEARKRIPELLERVRLDPELVRRNAEDLSIGQKQRVALARALMNSPDVLLLDEPTAALDPATSRAVLDMVVSLNNSLGLTLVMVTHDFTQAHRVGTAGAVVIGGRLRASGSLEVIGNSFDPDVQEFLRGGESDNH